MAAGLLIASLLETLNWTSRLGRFTAPLARFAHFGTAASAAFAASFVSVALANGILAENCDSGKISHSELLLANLFNSFPSFLAHLPGVFVLLWPALGAASVLYVALAFLAALLRLAVAVLLGRLTLPPAADAPLSEPPPARRPALAGIWPKAVRRFKKKLPKLIVFTVPCYFLIYFLQSLGVFGHVERFLASASPIGDLVNPQAMGIIALQLLAEMGATLGAAAALLDAGALDAGDIVLAMLVGSALASPMRALRHQLPAYAGFFRPALALRLILANQALRIFSLAVVVALCAVALK